MLKRSEPLQHPDEPEDERPVGDLVHQLIEDGKAYAQAELALAKATATAKGKALAVPAGLAFAALLFLQAAVTVLAVAILDGLAPFVGPILAGIIAMLLFAGVAAGLGWIAYQKVRKLP